MLKKIVLSILAVVMLFGLTVPSASLAKGKEEKIDLDAIENIELTSEQQKRADELWEQYVAITEILENLKGKEKQKFLDALFDRNFNPAEFEAGILLAEDTKEVTALNNMFEVLGSPIQFSSDVESVKVEENGDLVAVKPTGDQEIVPFGFWGGVWDATKCAASIAVVFVPGAQAYKAIKALGGVKNTVKLLAGASNASDWLEIGGWAAAEILGIAGVQEYCFNS